MHFLHEPWFQVPMTLWGFIGGTIYIFNLGDIYDDKKQTILQMAFMTFWFGPVAWAIGTLITFVWFICLIYEMLGSKETK